MCPQRQTRSYRSWKLQPSFPNTAVAAATANYHVAQMLAVAGASCSTPRIGTNAAIYPRFVATSSGLVVASDAHRGQNIVRRGDLAVIRASAQIKESVVLGARCGTNVRSLNRVRGGCVVGNVPIHRDQLARLVLLSRRNCEAKQRICWEDEVHGDGKAELFLRHRGSLIAGDRSRRNYTRVHYGVLIEHGEIHGIEINRLSAGEILLLRN